MTIQKIEHLLRQPKLRGHEARRGLTQAAHAICAGLGLAPVSVKFRYETATASMNSCGALCLADIDDDSVVSRAQFVRYVGYVVHELLHRKFTDFAKAHHRLDYVRSLHNAIEDAWIERTAIKSGLLGNIEGLLKALIDGMVAESLTAVKDWTDPRQYPWSLAVYTRGFAQRVPVPADLLAVWQEAARRVEDCTSTADCMLVAEWVYSQLQLPPDQRDQPEQGDEACDNPAPDGEPCDGEGDGEGESAGTEGEAEGEGDGEGTEGEGTEGEGTEGEGEGEAEGEGAEGEGDGKGKAEGDKGDDTPLAGDSRKPDEFCQGVEVEPTMRGTNDGAYGTYNESASVRQKPWLSPDPQHKDAALVTGKLRYEVRRLFENTGREDHQRNRRSGAVNVAALPSVATGNTRVFKRRVETEGIDSAVVLLLDISQSMYTDRLIGTAVASTVALGEALSAAGVDVCVATFGGEVCVVSPFGQPFKRKIDTLRRLHDNGSTNDYFATRYCHDMLLRHKAERKVLMVLTDGEGDMHNTRRQVEIGERLGVTTIGIGIRSNVGQVFPNSVRVDDIRTLGTVAFGKIKLAA